MVDPQSLNLDPLRPKSPLTGHGRERVGGGPEGPQVVLRERGDVSLATVIRRSLAPDQGAAGFETRFMAVLGAAPADRPSITRTDLADFIWTGPGQWLALSERIDLAAHGAQRLGDVAAFADQSHGRVVIRITGPRTRDLLARLCPVDVAPGAFGPDAAAQTLLGKVSAVIWRTPDGEGFEAAVPSSYAAFIWDEMVEIAAQFGVAAPIADGRKPVG